MCIGFIVIKAIFYKYNIVVVFLFLLTTDWMSIITLWNVSVFLIGKNSYYFHSIEYLGLKSIEKDFTLHFDPAFFILLIVKSFEILPKHSA